MKTKKEIFKWWEELGKKENNNDYQEFKQKISKKIKIEETKKGNHRFLSLSFERWKNKLYLYFFNNECYKILGF